MISNKRGFTLIELLVVIAIIGILASIVLVSFPSANNKAKDARVLAAMNQIRDQAAAYYTDNSTYAGFSCTLAAIKPLCDDIKAKAKSYPITPDIIRVGTTNSTDVCAYAELNAYGSTATWACFDGTGLIGKTTTAPSTAGNCTATTYVCAGAAGM